MPAITASQLNSVYISDPQKTLFTPSSLVSSEVSKSEHQKIHLGLLTQQFVFNMFMKGCPDRPPSIKHDL